MATSGAGLFSFEAEGDYSAVAPLWGAPRIHGELLKPGIDVGGTGRW